MSEHKVYTAIGLMSGTSLDGVDVACVRTDGQGLVEPIDFVFYPYTDDERAVIRAAFGKSKGYGEAETVVTQAHIKAVRDFDHTADVIGFHGQTIFHDPAAGVTVQIGDGQRLANETNMRVVNDFRRADVASGGQGAPLAPVYHQALALSKDVELPAVFLNIGGVSNVTYIGTEGSLLAFDTGPGNALMDDCMLARTGQRYDRDGALAASGAAHMDIVERWLLHSFFTAMPPKSLDRDAWDVSRVENLSDADALATLLEFTASSIARGAGYFPDKAKVFYVCGGGRHNGALITRLSEMFGARVEAIEVLGFNGDAIEAECFAYLAVRSIKGLPISFPNTTGIKESLTGGTLYKPD